MNRTCTVQETMMFHGTWALVNRQEKTPTGVTVIPYPSVLL